MAQPNALCTTDDFRTWRRLSGTSAADDGVIASLIDDASDEIQRFCRRVFRQASIVDETIAGDGSRTLRVRRPPITSVSALKIVRGAVVETIDPANYVIARRASDPDSEVNFNDGRVVLLADVYPVGVRNVLVSYVGGFATIPAPIRQACRELVAVRFSDAGRNLAIVNETSADGFRVERGSDGIPAAIKAKLAPYRLPLAAGLHPGAYERTRGAW
jgi:hypothetical protein